MSRVITRLEEEWLDNKTVKMLRELLCDTMLCDRKVQSFRKHLLPESSRHKASNARIVRTVTGNVCVI